MLDSRKDYSQHVDHPRYGRSPRHTGLDPDPNAIDVQLHWNTRIVSTHALTYLKRQFGDWPPPWHSAAGARVIPGTAIEADVSRQTAATIPVTHYYDLEKVCRDCGRHFLFFAEEQKFWYEELQLPLEADAVRCVECRRQVRVFADQKKRYEHLCHVASRNVEQNLEMAECCLSLVEQAIFHPRQTQHVRELLNLIPEGERFDADYVNLRERLGMAEQRNGSGEL